MTTALQTLSANQAAASGSNVIVNFDTAAVLPSGWTFDAVTDHRFESIPAGYYLVGVAVAVAGLALGQYLDVHVDIDRGSDIESLIRTRLTEPFPAIGYTQVLATTYVYLNGGGPRVWVRHNKGSNADILGPPALGIGNTSQTAARLWISDMGAGGASVSGEFHFPFSWQAVGVSHD